jgi:hypothetical protein
VQLQLPFPAATLRAVSPMGDIDGDGVPDVSAVVSVSAQLLLLQQQQLWTLRLLRNGTVWASTLVQSFAVGSGSTVNVSSPGDVNNDGVTDLVAVTNASTLIVLPLACPQCARVVASDAGRQPGIGNNDSLLVQFPCTVEETPFAVANSSADVDAFVAFSAPLGASYTGRWETSSSLRVTITNASGASAAETRIGLLTATARVCNGAQYAVAGSWGVQLGPRIVSAVAEDTGGRPGLGTNDSVLVTFDRDVDERAAAALALNVSLGAETAGHWVNPRQWRLVVLDAGGADAADVTRVGHVLIAGYAQSADLSSPLVPVSAALSGSWGHMRPPGIASAVAADSGHAAGLNNNDSVLVTFDADTSMPRPAATVIAFVDSNNVRVGAVPLFNATWQSARTLLIVFTANPAGWPSPLTGAAAAATASGTLRVLVVGDVRSMDLSSPASTAVCTVEGGWGNNVTSVTASNPQALSTAGGDAVTLTLAASLGAGGTPASATYSNGHRTYSALSCSVAADGGSVQCSSAPGVGTGYAWSLVLNRVPLLPSAGPMNSTSYGPPVITNVVIGGGAVAAAPGAGVQGTVALVAVPDGGQVVVIEGRNFGPASANAVSNVRFSPRGYSVPFKPTNCSVTTLAAGVIETVTCTMPACAGTSYVFSLAIDGQQTTDVSLLAAAPVITNVSAAPLDTAGGTLIVISGRYFGVPVDISGAVTVAYGGAALALNFAATACNVTVAQAEITCVAAPGYGSALQWRVTVLGVTSVVFKSSLHYVLPSLAVMYPPLNVPTAGATVTLSGVGFTPAFPTVMSAGVDGVTVTGVQALDTHNVTLVVPAGVGAVHTLAVGVAGLWSPGVPFRYRAPIVTAAAPFAGSVDYWDVQVKFTARVCVFMC